MDFLLTTLFSLRRSIITTVYHNATWALIRMVLVKTRVFYGMWLQM